MDFLADEEGRAAAAQSLEQCVHQGLKQLYQAQELCDATLVAEGRRFHCHRLVLASVSPYFLRMFSGSFREAQDGEVLLQDMASATLQSVLNYLYTGELTLTAENAQDLFTAACRLQLLPLEETVGRFLAESVSLESCLRLYALAHAHNHPALLHVALRCVSQDFGPLSKHEDFLLLDPHALIGLLSSDSLAVASELAVYRAVRRWVNSAPAERLPLLRELLSHLRLPLLTHQELAKMQADIAKRYGHVQLQWEKLGGKTRVQASGGLRQGMYQEGIVCVGHRMFPNFDEDDKEITDSQVHCLDPCAQSWHQLADLKGVRLPSCASVGRKLYASGGFGPGNYTLATLHEYDSFTNQWTKLPSMAAPRHKHAFLAWKQTLFDIAGDMPTGGDSAESFDLERSAWSPIASLPCALCDFASAVLKDKLYIIGGRNLGGNSILVFDASMIYDIASDTWTVVQQEVGRYYASAVAVDDGICVLGGVGRMDIGESDKHLKCFFVDEDGTLSEHRVLPQIPMLTLQPGVVRWQKRVYMLGGQGKYGCLFTVDSWEPGQCSWTEVQGWFPDRGYSALGSCCVTLQMPKEPLASLLQETSVSSVAVGVAENQILPRDSR
uniref:BTB domain-containing protein n=1 Tax=Sphenodon punctatus TaxID=8508 RepID=A0A8D0GVL9_SPHPU